MSAAACAPVFLGIDLGTQGVRVLARAPDGAVLASASRELTSRRDGSIHEQDPWQWRDRSLAALAETCAALPPDRRPAGLAICATSGSIALCSADGRPHGPGVMYDDARAGHLLAEVQSAVGDAYTDMGTTIGGSWALCTLALLARDGVLAGTSGSMIAHQGDVVAAALTGHRVATDSSHALKSGYHPARAAWPEELWRELAIPRAALPEVRGPGSAIGAVEQAVAGRLGLPPGLPIYAGMTDGCAAQLATGALRVGDCVSSVGTTLVLKGVSPQPVAAAGGALYSHRAPGDGGWLPGGASSSGAGIVRRLFAGVDLTELTRAAAEVEQVPVCYPLAGTGERFPVAAPAATGFLRTECGSWPLVPETVAALGAPVVFAAIAHGLADTERLGMETLAAAGVPVHGRLAFSGGASTNPWWARLRARVLGRSAELMPDSPPAAGMALLAEWGQRRAGGAGGELAELAAQSIRPAGTVEPTGVEVTLEREYARFLAELHERGWLPDVAVTDGPR